MIRWDYLIDVRRGRDGDWYVKEWGIGDNYQQWGPFRWWWVARLFLAIVRDETWQSTGPR